MLLAKGDDLQPGAGGEHQPIRGVGIQLTAVAAIGINQGCNLVFESEGQYQNLFVGGPAKVVDELAAHLGDISRGCYAILIGVCGGAGTEIKGEILDCLVVAETTGLPS